MTVNLQGRAAVVGWPHCLILFGYTQLSRVDRLAKMIAQEFGFGYFSKECDGRLLGGGMHILLALLGAMGVVGIILWRLHMAAEAAKGLVETAHDARGLFRRWGWRRKFAKDPLDLISDPREAVVAMMVAVAQHDGAITERERNQILREATGRFEASSKQAEELLAQGRWLTRDVRDADLCIARLTPFLQRHCSADQLLDVITMLRAVAEADGKPDDVVVEAIARLQRIVDHGAKRS